MAKKIAVIGAGCSGLVSMKCLLDDGLEPVCFERTTYMGGLWRFREDTEDGQGSVAKSTVINCSKEMMSFSDFPMPKEFPNFMHNTKVDEYFHMYADKFNVRKYIRFHTEILRMSKGDDFAQTGKWQLKVRDLESGAITMETYDAVMVCTGHHAQIYWPKFPGMEDFQGKTLHTHSYKDQRGYEDKRVVIIGIGNSGGDTAVELGRCAKQVFLSTRRGAWVMNRVSKGGLPGDMLNLTRTTFTLLKYVPTSVVNFIVEKRLNNRFDHAMYGLKPDHGFYAQPPIFNDDLPNRIICGSVIIKPDIKNITKTGVEFVDGTFEDNIDVIIFATGYKFGFPFIDEDVIKVDNNVVNLYKYVFPPNLEQPTMTIMGCIQPIGATMPLVELQARWAAAVFKGSKQLPSREEMWRDIEKKKAVMASRYVKSNRHTIEVDCVPYMDELAQQVGCRPNLVELFFKDPKLALNCFCGPCTPYQYRLQGPGTWDGAKQAIETQWDRVAYPLKTRQTSPAKATLDNLLTILVLVLAVLIAVWFIMSN